MFFIFIFLVNVVVNRVDNGLRFMIILVMKYVLLFVILNVYIGFGNGEWIFV